MPGSTRIFAQAFFASSTSQPFERTFAGIQRAGEAVVRARGQWQNRTAHRMSSSGACRVRG
ncbi:hypothetical protein, partial [Psychrobacter sp. TB20-MNA-CIBAN-0197]|uniref:hypothetical protein n=1 Tax=Psychrobacter sp. TB20-MNA-CIBAN-0197 TaxID=3140453 RepID=UPI0033280753